MKKIIIYPILLTLILSGVAFAQEQANLPDAGLTPESNFYFLDRFSEVLINLLTFGPKAKARLQLEFAIERINEITVILKTRGAEAKGLEVAQSRLRTNLERATAIVADQKAKGEDVGTLANELDDRLRASRAQLQNSFREQKQALDAEEEKLKAELKAKKEELKKLFESSEREKYSAEVETVATLLEKLEARQEFLRFKKENIEDELETEKEKLAAETELKNQAAEAIAEAEEEKQELVDEAVEEELKLPATTFAEFNKLLLQAKSAFDAGKFEDALKLAKQAEASLDKVKDILEGLEKKKELAEEAKEEKTEQPAPPPKEKPALKKIPSEAVETSPLVLVSINAVGGVFRGQVGTKLFNMSFSAEGGLPPYYFKLDTGVGFPPLGVILEPNGLLSGTPSAPGTSVFGVCAVDTSGKSKCRNFTMIVESKEEEEELPMPIVEPEPAPPPSPSPSPPPEINPAFSITLASCQLTKYVGQYDNEYTVSVVGTASGPVGARLVLPGLSGYISHSWTSSWGNRTNDVEDRGVGDPETTNWTSTLVVGSGTKTVSGYVRVGSNKISDSRTVTCQ